MVGGKGETIADVSINFLKKIKRSFLFEKICPPSSALLV